MIFKHFLQKTRFETALLNRQCQYQLEMSQVRFQKHVLLTVPSK